MFAQFITPEKDRFFPLAKICRLCADTNGPFMNIFDEVVQLDSKINELLPIKVNETDDFPHKLCYMCSAKLQDFQNFVKKCMETQHNFHKSIGKTRHPNKEFYKMKDRKTESETSIPSIKLYKQQNDWVVRKYNLKDLRIVLTRVEDEDPREIRKRIEEATRAETKPPYSVINVTGFGTIFTCNYCNEVFTKDTINTHKCKNRKEAIESLNHETKFNGVKLKSRKRTFGQRISSDSRTSTDECSEPPNKIKKINSEYPCITTKAVRLHLARLSNNLVKHFQLDSKSI